MNKEIKLCSNSSIILNSVSLGKKTYQILPIGRGKIWYWSKYKNSSAWYKSVKVLEQNTPANWDGVIDNLYEKLSYIDTLDEKDVAIS